VIQNMQTLLKAITVVVFVLSTAVTASVTAQRPGGCGEPTPTALEAVQERTENLEAEVATLLSDEKRTPEIDSLLRSSQEKLLSAVDELACLQEKSVSGTKGWPKTTTFVQLPLLFATDRVQTPLQSAPDLFGSDQRSVGLQFGRLQAVIPEVAGVRTSFVPGTTRTARPAREGRSQLSSILLPAEDRFWSSLQSAIQSSRAGGDPVRILLFVHGFNVTFTEAALAGARLAASMQMPVVPVFYSWPSEGRVLGYWRDEEMITTSSLRFSSFLEKLAAVPNAEVAIVAHSMGSRIVTRSLAELGRRGATVVAIRKVILAAADLARNEFEAQWPSLQMLKNIQWTMYASSSDFALRVSTYIHRFRRVGETKGEIFIQPGTDTIDASSTTSILQAFGHSYVIGSPAIAVDIADWVSRNLSPASRGLRAQSQNGLTFYRFP
jgi:esterase/lipase superfamily enzyme